MIGKLFEYFVGSFFISIATYYVAIKITERKFELIKWHVFKWILLESVFMSIFYFIEINDVLRMFLNIVMLINIYYLLFNFSLFQCILLSFMFFSLSLISEFIFIIFNVLFFKLTTSFIKNYYFATITGNFIITLIIILISNINCFISIYKSMFKEFRIKSNLHMFVIIISSIFCLIMLLYYIFFDVNPIINLLISLFLVVCYIIFTIVLVEEKSVNFKLKIQYETILKDIENYEKNLTEQRIKNHESKNILISIKGMLRKEDSTIRAFIDQIISDNIEEDKNILFITKNIPTGVLQGLVYQKLLLMKNKNIKYFINIDKEITKDAFNKLPINVVKDICIIVGVFIDNSIQELDNNKEKLFYLSIYRSGNKIIIEVSNNCCGIIDINQFDKKGYTTKGKNHGYGLSLVKDIINKNKTLENIKEIRSNIFIQKLIIYK